MRVSYNWIQEYFEEKLPEPKKLAELLTFHSYEVESVEAVGDDYVLDIDILPNRAHDSLSHRGVAKEVSVLINKPLKNDPFQLGCPTPKLDSETERKTEDFITLSIEDKGLCRRATKQIMVDVVVKESPEWLKNRLEVLGQRSINNIVDATNYVMFDTGQPVHAFDFDKLTGGEKKNIHVRGAKNGEKVTAFDGIEYILDEHMVVIADDEKALDIAGIKGGIVSGIDEDTKKVLLSACSFDPVNTRKTSRKLKLATDASQRFQNDISPELTKIAIQELSKLIKDIACGDVTENIVDVYPKKENPYKIEITASEVSKLLGVDISTQVIEDIIKRLDFEYTLSDEEFTITPPFERIDLKIKADLIEEIGRIYGYENIEAITPENVPIGGEKTLRINKKFYYTQKIKNFLIHEGFSEVYTYAFRDSGEVEIENPFASDKNFLRKDLQGGLKSALEQNSKNKPLFEGDEIKIFEIGDIFLKEKEYTSFGIGCSGNVKYIEEAVKKLSKVLGVEIGGIIKENIFEVDFDELIEKLGDPTGSYEQFETNKKNVVYSPISHYPFVLRDIAVWVPEDVVSDEVFTVIKKEAGDLLVNMKLFDEFKKDEKISYAFNLVFQSQEKTLSDEEINKVMDSVTKTLEGNSSWKVR